MLLDQKICIILYSITIMQCIVVSLYIYIKAKKTESLIALIVVQILSALWLFFGMIENMSSTNQELMISIRLSLFPITFIGSAWLVFVLVYLGKITFHNRFIIFIIFLFPIITYFPLSFSVFFALLLISVFKNNLFEVAEDGTNEIFNSIEDAIVILDNDNNIIKYNNALTKDFISLDKIQRIKDLASLMEYFSRVYDWSGGSTYEQIKTHDEKATFKGAYERYKPDTASRGVHITYILRPFYDSQSKKLGRLLCLKNDTALVEMERKKIADDFHDNIGTIIRGIWYTLIQIKDSHLSEVEVQNKIKVVLSELRVLDFSCRQVIENLNPINVIEMGLVSSTQRMLKKISQYGIETEFITEGFEGTNANNTLLAAELYKIIVESVNNSIKHGGASQIKVYLNKDKDGIKLSILDNGKCGDKPITPSNGMLSIKARASNYGGQYSFFKVDKGMCAKIVIPQAKL